MSRPEMIRTTAILMTAASVLWHAAVGCCAHHDHAECGQAAEAICAAHADDDREAGYELAHDEHCREHADRHDQHDDHDSPGPCRGEQCSFAVAKIIKAGDLNLEPEVGATVACEMIAFAAKPILSSRPGDSVERPPPLRRHLALGILLI